MKKVNKKDIEALYKVLLTLETMEEAGQFFRDLLTETEIRECAERWKAARMLAAGVPYTSIIDQVHAALERGAPSLESVQSVVNVDSIGVQYTPGATAPDPGFKPWVTTLVRKVYQESRDGVVR